MRRSPRAAPRVLLIDDNHELTDNLVELFDLRGFRAHVAPTAAAGLAFAQDEGFDVAFVDVKLPDSSGLELLPALRAAEPVGEVVLMTGHATVDSAIAAVRGGAFHYVVKPFKAEDLMATAESALRQVTLRNERELLARQLDVSERRYRDVVESVPALVLALDAQGTVRIANRRAAESAGLPLAELLGESVFGRLFAPELRELVTARLHSALEGRGPVEFEAPLATRDGRARTVRWQVTASSAPSEAGAGAASLGAGERDGAALLYLVGADVTERLRLERRAAEAEALAQMSTLAAGLAHEIRNPLNAAGLQLHLLGRGIAKLGEGVEKGPLRARVDIVASELKRLELLLGDFLELARPRPIAREPVALEPLLDEVLALHEPQASARGVALTRTAAPLYALGDRERLKQVLHNLVLNALEATPEGSTVRVAAQREPGEPPMLALTVSDVGKGIAAAALARVFEPFFTTKAAGTGLGLPIVRQIVQRHGGTVDVASEEGRGTRVTVRLPAASGADPR